MTKAEQIRLRTWRLKALQEVTGASRSVARACRHFGISRQAFYKWKRRYDVCGEAGLCACRPFAFYRTAPCLCLCLERLHPAPLRRKRQLPASTQPSTSNSQLPHYYLDNGSPGRNCEAQYSEYKSYCPPLAMKESISFELQRDRASSDSSGITGDVQG